MVADNPKNAVARVNSKKSGKTSEDSGPDFGTRPLDKIYLKHGTKTRCDRDTQRSPTCVAFGGENYETLYVTSQQSFLTPEELAHHPRPGSLFAVHGLGARGLPEPRFGASKTKG